MTQSAMIETAELLTAMESAMDGIAILDAHENYVYVNSAHAQVYGYDNPNELLGKSWTILYEEQELERFKRDLMPEFRREGKIRIEAIGKKKDGTKFPQEVSLTALANGGLICVVRDISSRKLAEERIEQLSLFPMLNPGPEIRFDMTGSILNANPAAVTILRLPEQGNVKLDQIIPDTAELDLAKCISEGNVLSCRSSIGERYFHFVFRGIPHLGVGHMYGSDISDLRRLQDELLQAQKMEAIGQLAGGIAHDFNNLLTAILGSIDVMKVSLRKTPDTLHHLDLIESAASQASQLTQKLLGFARKGKHQNVPVLMHKTIEDTLQLLARTIEKNIAFKVNFCSPDPAVMGDPVQLQQVLLNLVLNARDALRDESGMARTGEINISTRVVSRTSEGQSTTTSLTPFLEIIVTDTGCGILPEIRDKIFEPFFTTKQNGKGTGLGLSMVYGIVQNHDGSIAVESEVGSGTSFKIYLPCLDRSKVAPLERLHGNIKLGKARILVVDDHAIVREATSKMLASLGYDVRSARDGLEAVKIFKLIKEKIDLVLLDLVMPDMGGRECLKALRAIDPTIKVILCSGYSKEANGDDGEIAEVSAFLQKPFQLQQLSEALHQALSVDAARKVAP